VLLISFSDGDTFLPHHFAEASSSQGPLTDRIARKIRRRTPRRPIRSVSMNGSYISVVLAADATQPS
jgi:hypothetical protein